MVVHLGVDCVVYTALANILCALGICYCTMGHHEEGMAMRGELDELQRRLDTNFPSLAWLMELNWKRRQSNLCGLPFGVDLIYHANISM